MNIGNIRIVLVNTSHPGNIGAAARAMKNMFLHRLYLVEPRHFPHSEASARASGADDILQQAEVCDTLEEALTGCAVVYGTSARLRSIRWPQVDAREMAVQVGDESTQHEVAIVFGREHSGLRNEELDLCNYLLHIPTNPDYSSLNVAAAVQIACYELMMVRGQGQSEVEGGEPLASSEEREGFYSHLEQTLVELDFLDPDKPRHLMRRLKRLYNRCALERQEINILRGILKATRKTMGK